MKVPVAENRADFKLYPVVTSASCGENYSANLATRKESFKSDKLKYCYRVFAPLYALR